MEESTKSSKETLITSLRIFWGHLRRSDRDGTEKDKAKLLKRLPFFENLKKHELSYVANLLFERDYQEGEFIFEVGQPGAALFIIQSGEVAVEIEDQNHGVTVIAKMEKNSFLGELALLDQSPRSASARAVVPTRVLALFRSDLDRILSTEPRIAAQIYKSLATIVGARLKATNELLEKRSLKAVA
jgi:CRP-like cAMP-binding protein